MIKHHKTFCTDLIDFCLALHFEATYSRSYFRGVLYNTSLLWKPHEYIFGEQELGASCKGTERECKL